MQQAFQIVDADGNADDVLLQALGLDDSRLLELLKLMMLVRRADAEATALQRQGQLAVYPPLLGQEAAQVGSAFALDPSDFIFPSYRELGAAVVKGVDLVDYLHFYRGTWHGGTYDPLQVKFGMVSVPVGSQILHAVGYAMGAQLDGKPVVTLVYFGDGATSQGDFSEGCNFAAVFRSPVIFFCQNNQWAISVPLEKQTAAPIWRKADAYGFPGVRVDGNDVLAVFEVVRRAAARARAGGGPTLIEAVTYRLGPHSTADDAGRYQPKEQIEMWRGLDPIARYSKLLRARGLLNDATEGDFAAESDKLAAYIREGMVNAPPPALDDLFRWVFEEPDDRLRRQRSQLMEEAEWQARGDDA